MPERQSTDDTVTLDIPQDLLRRAERIAQQDGVTIDDLIVAAFEAYIAGS
jgi:NRPS condensation-like uncharacterized protein